MHCVCDCPDRLTHELDLHVNDSRGYSTAVTQRDPLSAHLAFIDREEFSCSGPVPCPVAVRQGWRLRYLLPCPCCSSFTFLICHQGRDV